MKRGVRAVGLVVVDRPGRREGAGRGERREHCGGHHGADSVHVNEWDLCREESRAEPSVARRCGAAAIYVDRRVPVLCETGRSLPRHLSTGGPHIGVTGPDVRSRRLAAHGRRRASTDALMNRSHGELVTPASEGPCPGARAGRCSRPPRRSPRRRTRWRAGRTRPRRSTRSDRARSTCRSPTPPAARSPAPAAAATRAAARLDLLPGQPGDRLAGDPARARQPRQLRLRLGAELHRVQAQRPRLRLPGREPRDLGLHGHVARPGPAHLLPGRRAGQGHAPAPAADRRGARRALRRQPGADARPTPTTTSAARSSASSTSPASA